MPMSKKAYVKSVLKRRKYERRERIKQRIFHAVQCFAACMLFEVLMIAFVLAA